LSNQQGHGTGKLLMDYILNKAKQNFQDALLLNVNKYNTSRFFYEKLGFALVGEEIIDIGNGYVMDDFIMEYLIKNN
jgi:GNAT superfamily N-acetyltransferase